MSWLRNCALLTGLLIVAVTPAWAQEQPNPTSSAVVGSVAILSRDSREEVDAIVKAAAATGGKADVREPQDMGWLYTRAFEDPDGHVFEAISADMAAAAAEMEK